MIVTSRAIHHDGRLVWVAFFCGQPQPAFWSWKKEYAVANLVHWMKTHDA